LLVEAMEDGVCDAFDAEFVDEADHGPRAAAQMAMPGAIRGILVPARTCSWLETIGAYFKLTFSTSGRLCDEPPTINV
jgi:hypothetical protein